MSTHSQQLKTLRVIIKTVLLRPISFWTENCTNKCTENKSMNMVHQQGRVGNKCYINYQC